MSKRCVVFIGTLKQGGAERVISILTRQMAQKNLDVKILLYYDEPIFYELDPRVKIDIVEKNTNSRNILKNIFWIRKYFKNQADVLLSFLAPFNMLALVAAFGLRTSVIVADRNDPRYVPGNRYIRFARNVLYRLADGVVVQTKYNQDYFPKKIRDNSVVIANPVDLGDNAGKALRADKRREIVSIGRLMPQKNQNYRVCNKYVTLRQIHFYKKFAQKVFDG